MPVTDHAHASVEQRRAHEVVRLLRARLTELGLPEDQVRQVVPVTDMERRAYVRLGRLTVDSASVLLSALGGTPVDSRPALTEGHSSS